MTVQPIQPQDRRPKKATERARNRKQQAMDAETFAVRVDGKDYILNPNDITGATEFRFRKEVGTSIGEYTANAQTAPSIDQLGVLMWAARLANGEEVELMEVLEGITLGSKIEQIEVEVEAPKASAKSS